jgi:hypothetical protein
VPQSLSITEPNAQLADAAGTEDDSMTDDDFDLDVDALIEEILPLIEGRDWNVTIYALVELLLGGAEDQDDMDAIFEIVKDVANGLFSEEVTIQ